MTMNTSPPPEQPHLDDEAVSAALDGQATASDRLHLAGCERCSARRDALEAARAAIAAPVETLDEAARRMLLSRALEGAVVVSPATSMSHSRRRWFERPAMAGAAAAAVLVALVAVGSMVGGDGGGTDESASRSAAPAAEGPESLAQDSAAGGLFVGELGDVSSADSLQFLAARERAGGADEEYAANPKAATARPLEDSGEGTGSPGALPAPAPLAPASPAAGSQEASPPSTGVTEADAQRCADILGTGDARGSALRALASGNLDGKPVVVVAFERDGRVTAYVTDVGTCEVLRSYEL